MTRDTLQLNEVVVVAGRLPERRADVPVPITTISSIDIQRWNAQTSADVLQQTGQVFVQRSQMGGGSPVLRGFEANRVLIVVDGVRMNNAIYRSGHLQNVITLDPNVQNRVEVLYGAGSVMYGSDALGGVMHFQTKNAEFAQNGKLQVAGGAFTRFSSANSEKSLHANVNLGWAKWASLTSMTASDFGDLRAGRRGNPFQSFEWQRNVYAARLNNRDTALVNARPEVQIGSAYRQLDLLQKVSFRPNAHATHTLNLQYSTSSDVPRYDRLSEIGTDGRPSFAEWYYGPQKRLFTTYKWQTTRKTALYDDAQVILSYQNIEESRYSRRFGNNNLTARVESLNIYGLNADLLKKTGEKTVLNYGAEWYFNDVRSTARRENILTGQRSYATTRYPDGGSTMNLAGVYGRLKWQASSRLLLIPAVRFSYVGLQASTNDPLFSSFFTNVRQSNAAVNGQVGGVLNLANNWRITSAVSTGFRAPNVDDLGKTFESAGGSNLTVPNPGLRPEHTVTAEIGLEKRFGSFLRFETNVFYTWMRNAIRLVPGTFNSRDTVVFDDQRTRVFRNENIASARVYGFFAGAEALLHHYVTASATFTYTVGRDITQAVPLDHIPPAYGRFGIRGHNADQRFGGEFFVLFNGWKRLRDYSPSGEDNLQYAIPTEGMPAWYTLNLRGSYRMNRFLQLQVAAENLADTHYRVFSSGISGAGRNFVVALRGSF